MIEYIYIVKCPGCEDEMFNFFTDARMQCDLVMSKHPIITQVEIERNDFGECTNHCDLGTVWSWEEAMKDTEGRYTEAEPAKSIFTKDDLKPWIEDEDPEFDNIDNSVDCEEPETSGVSVPDDIPDNSRKPISENAIQDGGFRTDGYRTALACYDSDDFDINVEFGLQNEDEYEVEDQLYLLRPGQTVADLVVYLSRKCGFTSVYVYGETSATRGEMKTATRFETEPGTHDYRHYGTIEDRLVEKCTKKDRKPIPEGMTIEQLVEEMEENEDEVECTWCNELFGKDQCRKEVDLGWLCSRCEMAIKSRGETLTFRENNYWDFLDEAIEDTRTLEDLVKDSINHLTNDLGKDPWADDFADDVIKDIENNYNAYVPEDMEQYNHWCSAVASEVSRQVNSPDNITEGFSWIKAGDRFTLATDNGDEHYIVRTTYDKEDEKHLDKYERFIQVAKETSDGTFENPIDIEYVVLADYKKRGKLMFESKSFLENLEWHTYKITYSTRQTPIKSRSLLLRLGSPM